jgi:hypothetical protein
MFWVYAPIVRSDKFRQAAYGILQYKERKLVGPLCGNAHLLLGVCVCEEWCLGVTMSVIGRSWLPGCMGGWGMCAVQERGGVWHIFVLVGVVRVRKVNAGLGCVTKYKHASCN